MIRRLVLVVVLLSVALAAGARRRAAIPVAAFALDAHRSFAITERAILDGFPFERVMTTLAGAQALPLYQQWLDTQNPKPGLDASMPHCDDFPDGATSTYNGFRRRCPTPEGVLARTNPFTPAEYVPLALVNRFDMTPASGAHCGQYRLVFARRGDLAADRLHVIFEAVLPNPDPSNGIRGCRSVAQFWADLSGVDSVSERRARLERFFFDDVLKPEHFNAASGGGIRTFHNTSGSGVIARFYQFRLEKRCTASGCRLVMEPDTLENTPPGSFFDATRTDERATRFRAELLRQVPNLAIRDVNGFFVAMPREFLMAESDPGERDLSVIPGVAFNGALTTPEGQQFHDAIAAQLRAANSTLTPLDIVRRAEVLTCTGCHVASGALGDGVEFPRSFGVEHLSEERTEQGEAGPRFTLSPAMKDVFLPKRMEILRNFLMTGAPPVRSN